MSETPAQPESLEPADTAAADTASLADTASPADTSSAPAPAAETRPLDPAEHPALARPARTSRPGMAAAVIASLAVGAVVGGVSGGGVALWATSQNQAAPAATSGPQTVTVNDTEDATVITAVAQAAMPSVVTISVSGDSAAGTGSGVILDDSGHILTNAHVVTLDGAVATPTIRVQTSDGRLLDATVVGVDPISDLAVIQVDSAGLTPISFGDSTALNVGDRVIAIGAPLGLAGTVTDGIVSALNRSITVASSAVPEQSDSGGSQGDGQSPFDFWNFDMGEGQQSQSQSSPSSSISLAVIQTDAAINPGNSGGALLDSQGKLIGINVAIASAGSSSGQSGSIGVGFAIPASVAQRVAQELIETGTATHGLLGASVADVTQDENQKNATVVGASIVSVVDGGAAAAGGLRAGDIITAINGLPVTGKTDLTAQVRALAAGSAATLEYVRDGKAYTTDVTLGTLQ
jgi:putative serine protease PepD